MVVSLNYCSQNGGNIYRAPYYNGNPNIGPRIVGNLDQESNGKDGQQEGNSEHIVVYGFQGYVGGAQVRILCSLIATLYTTSFS